MTAETVAFPDARTEWMRCGQEVPTGVGLRWPLPEALRVSWE
jgi:hypothetical protein